MSERNEALVLAHYKPFALGSVVVDPSRRQVRKAAESITVEPRVLEALVALAEAKGDVLSRDDLIAQAWGGTVVGDNAIQRAISRARQIASEFADGSFTIETIRGVGYRLTSAPPAGHLPERDRDKLWNRRTVLAGTLALAVGGGAFAVWRQSEKAPISLTARAFYDQAEALSASSSSSDWNGQAMSLYQAAIDADPRFADAWAGLAMTHVRALYSVRDERVNVEAARAKRAANRALELYPEHRRARSALITVEPRFGAWDSQRRKLEALAEGAANAELLGLIGGLHLATGNVAAAKPIFEQLLAKNPADLGNSQTLARIYWRLGRSSQVERLLTTALDRYPRHYGSWNAYFDYLLLSGRTQEAERFLADERHRPSELSPQALPNRRAIARAMGGRDTVARESLVQSLLRDLAIHPAAYPRVIAMLGALNEERDLVAVFDGYYFGRGQFARRLKAYSRRETGFLFAPYLDASRSDPRFAAAMEAIGLPVYPVV